MKAAVMPLMHPAVTPQRLATRRHLSADAGAQLATLLGIDAANAGKGEAVDLGAVLALTGTGSFYGKTMTRGLDLAAKHIEAAGGPKFNYIYLDHKSGDAAAGEAAITELSSKKVAAKFASYVDDLGAMLAGTAQYKIFTLDGGGGTSIFGQGQDYFWGTRAITPNDPMPGLFEYLKQTYPDKKTVGLVGWDIGEPNNTTFAKTSWPRSPHRAYEFNDLYELVPVGGQDFSQVLPKVKANEPDILLVSNYGQDPGSFADQAAVAGLTPIRIGFEFTPDGADASKGAYDRDGYTFAYDYFDAKNPISPLAKLFVSEFVAAVRRGSRLLCGQLLRERVGDVGGHASGHRVGWRHPRWRRARQGSAREPDGRQRVRRRREHRWHVHPRRNDALGAEARHGRLRVQGRHRHAEGVLRHRWRGLPPRLSNDVRWGPGDGGSRRHRREPVLGCTGVDQ